MKRGHPQGWPIEQESTRETRQGVARATRGATAAHLAQGAAIGVALWCMLFSMQLLPGFTSDTWGVLLFAAIGVGARFLHAEVILAAALILFAVVVLVVTQTSLANIVARKWARRDPLPAQSLDAVVVLSGGVNPDTTMTSGALDNLLTGLELIHEGRSKVLVTTITDQRFPTGVIHSVVDQSRIISQFRGPGRWLRTPSTTSTRDEAVGSAELLMPMSAVHVAVVADPMHTRRACAAFEKVGFKVTCVAARVRSDGGPDPAPWPRDRLRVFGDWVYELLAMLEYRARGWVATLGESPCQTARPLLRWCNRPLIASNCKAKPPCVRRAVSPMLTTSYEGDVDLPRRAIGGRSYCTPVGERSTTSSS